MSTATDTIPAVVPAPRISTDSTPADSAVDDSAVDELVEEDPPRRRHRPPTQYWDVFQACWRSAPGVSCGAPEAW